MAKRSSKSTRTPSLQPRVKVWLENNEQYVFGFGISEILKAIDQAGSIKAASESLGKSYRHIWSRVKCAEEALGRPLVESRVGGQGASRSSLTPEARRLVADFDALRQRMFDVLEHEFASRFLATNPTNSHESG